MINMVVHFYNLGLFLQLCVIAECGELKEGDDWGIFPKDGSGDSYPDFPEDADIDLKDVSTFRSIKLSLLKLLKIFGTKIEIFVSVRLHDRIEY